MSQEDLSYRSFLFSIDIGVGHLEELVSPEIEGIEEAEWDLMSIESRKEWLNRASKEWAMESIEIAWG